MESPDGAVGGCVAEDFCISVVEEVGDRPCVVEVFVEVFGAGGFDEVSGRDEDELSVRVEVEGGFEDKKQVEVGAAVKSWDRGG